MILKLILKTRDRSCSDSGDVQRQPHPAVRPAGPQPLLQVQGMSEPEQPDPGVLQVSRRPRDSRSSPFECRSAIASVAVTTGSTSSAGRRTSASTSGRRTTTTPSSRPPGATATTTGKASKVIVKEKDLFQNPCSLFESRSADRQRPQRGEAREHFYCTNSRSVDGRVLVSFAR